MIRVDRGTVYQVLMMLLYSRDNGWDPETAREYVYRRYYMNPPPTKNDELGPAYATAFSTFFKTKLDVRPASWQEFIEGFLKQVLASQEGEYGDLIDELARILQSPYARNTLSGNVLVQLRKAILIPSEIGEFKRMVRMKEMACVNCGAALIDGEMTTIMADEDGTSIFCNRCAQPYSVKCSNMECNGLVVIDKKYRVGSERFCDDCLVAKGKLNKEDLDKKRAGQPGLTFRGGRRGGGVARAIPAQPQTGVTSNAPAIAYTFTVGGTTNNGG